MLDFGDHGELKEEVRFALSPGNLAWGMEIMEEHVWVSLVTKGIQREKEVGYSSWGLTPDIITFALLSSSAPPTNYQNADHEGPGTYRAIGGTRPGHFRLGIIVKTDAVIRSFPGQLRAVGKIFLHPGTGEKGIYTFDQERNMVFGIPVAVPQDRTKPWVDEVRLYEKGLKGRAGKVPNIPTGFWSGICVEKENFKTLRRWHQETQRNVSVPIFTPQGELISIGF